MINQGQIDQITATSLLEDLKSTEAKTKINAIHNLRGISFALGRERTRKELLPFLASYIDEEEDDILIELAKALSNFLDCIGGKGYTSEIFSILETLLCVDEVNIRNEAINALKAIVKEIGNVSEIENQIIDMINRLGKSENENQKISSINIISFIYMSLNEKNKSICRELITAFSKDQLLNVKKELCASIQSLSVSLPVQQIKELIQVFMSDTSDNIKTSVVDIILSLSNHPSQSELIDFIITIITQLSKEEKWRIKLALGDKLCELFNFKFINLKLKNTILDIFDNYISDVQPEIRNVSCLKLEEIAKRIGNEDCFEKILKKLPQIAKDTTIYVRGALAGNLLKIAPLIGLKKTNDYIIPVFLEFLKDENHDIRMTLIKTLEYLDKVIKIENIIQSIIPSCVDITANKSWRVRSQIIDVVPILSSLLDKKTFMDKIFGIGIAGLIDPVFAIRESSCKLIKNLYEKFKGDEFVERIEEKLTEMTKSKNYLVRNTVVMFIKTFCEDYKDIYKSLIEKKFSGIIFILSKDKISNVRMNCASVLLKMKVICTDQTITKQISECIEILKKDKDPDVVRILK